MASPFTDRAVNLNNMFYDGLSYDENGVPVYGGFVTAADGDEWAWVQENVPGGTETDVSRLPRDGMYQVLHDTLYGETPIPDDLAPEGWTYWDKTDCWYHAHGDTGPDITRAAMTVWNAAVEKAYGGKRKIEWLEVLAGEKAFKATGEWLPQATLDACRENLVSIKGPLTTPVGGGIRSINVAMRQELDLYVCLRPVP